MKFKKRYILLIPFLVYVLLCISGCFQFRMSKKKATKFFKSSNEPVVLKDLLIDSLNRNIHFAETLDTIKPFYVLFVHGSPGSGSNFYNYLIDTSLQSKAQLASVDRPGYGYSDFGKSEPNLDNQAKAIAEIVLTHQNQKVILVGHSLGGPVIVKIAMNYPELTDGLFIIAGSVDPAAEPDESWRKPMNSVFLKWMLPRSIKVSNQEIIPLKPQLIQMSNDWDKVKCKVYVLQGLEDKLVPPLNADFIANKLPQHQRIIIKLKDKNHFIPFTDQSLVVNHILQFIENYGQKEE
jgi:pimeloyl-ACP methyl ester carboxylesterase